MKIPYRNPWFIGPVAVLVIFAGWWFFLRGNKTTTAPVTTSVEQGTLVQTVSSSGSLIAKVQADVNASDYGRVTKLYVKNGDEVKADQPLLLVQSLASAADKAKSLASLLSAQDSFNQTNTKISSLAASLTTAQQQLQDAQKNEQILANTVNTSQLALDKSKIDAKKSLEDARKGIVDAAQSQNTATSDLGITGAQIDSQSASLQADSAKVGSKQTVATAKNTLAQAQRDQASAHLKTQSAQLSYNAAQGTYNNQQTSISASSAQLASSRLSYQLLTNQTVTAPVAGRIVNLSVIEGGTVGSSSTSSSSSSSSSGSSSSSSSGSKIFSIIDFNSLRAVVSVSEVDIPNIKLGQAATLTFDAIPDKTYTGTVTNTDTVGTTTSGVTNYNVEISLDSLSPELKPGMSVSASIITNKKDNVLLVPSTAIQTTNGQSIVYVMTNSTPTATPVTIGDSNDSQTEITAGLSAGQQILSSASTAQTGTTTSAFSGNRNSLFGGGGGALRVGNGGGGGRGGN